MIDVFKSIFIASITNDDGFFFNLNEDSTKISVDFYFLNSNIKRLK